MKHKPFWQGVLASVGMLILILDGKTALEGAQTGIELCLRTVVPSLFPFFLLSVVLTDSFSGISMPLLQPFAKLCRIPKGAESIWLSGYLGGYPVGAQCISQAYSAGQLRRSDAERMLAFCNNAGPAFLFGMISSVFPEKWYAWALWGIHIASSIFVALVLPGDRSEMSVSPNRSKFSLSEALNSAIRVMLAVCGWVILFRVMITFMERWFLWMLPVELQVLLTGLLELSNGCCALLSVSDIRIRFLICSGILAFGGLCVTMQTVSVVNKLSLRFYLQGKLMQTIFSLILSWGLLYDNGILCFTILIAVLLILRKIQKKSSIYEAVGV